jgi:hypothetical protein
MDAGVRLKTGRSSLLRVSGEEFKALFNSHLLDANNLTVVASATIKILGDLRAAGADNIGFTCGIISSEGLEHIDRNMKRHAMYTASLRDGIAFPVFSASDVFNDERMFERVKYLPQEEWLELWRKVLNSGFVTHLFFTPRWQKSSGARDEHEVGKGLGLEIYYVQNELGDQLRLAEGIPVL